MQSENKGIVWQYCSRKINQNGLIGTIDQSWSLRIDLSNSVKVLTR